MVQTERNITRPFMQCRHASRNWTLLCAKISTFFGLVFSGRGMSPDPAKIEATQKADPFSSVIDVRSLSGMTNYMSRFIRDYADIVAPLTWAHSLTTVLFKWERSIKQLSTGSKTVLHLTTSWLILTRERKQSYWWMLAPSDWVLSWLRMVKSIHMAAKLIQVWRSVILR